MVNFMLSLSVLLMAIGLLLVALRLIRGPHVADRILTLDMITLMLLPIIGIIAWIRKTGFYFDVALVYGLISFLSVLAAIRYLDLTSKKERDHGSDR